MRQALANALVPTALTVTIVLSLVVFAQPTTALQSAVTGPGQVTQHDPVELSVVVTSTADESVDVQNYTLTITPEGVGESVHITFDRDGTVLSVDPPRGVVGPGSIRVDRLRRDLAITAETSTNDSGYGYGYGYGNAETTTAFSVVVPSAAFKHGTYTATASVNTAQSGAVTSPEASFTVLNPAGLAPPQNDDHPTHTERGVTSDHGQRTDRGQGVGPGETSSQGTSPDRGETSDRRPSEAGRSGGR